MSGLPALSPAGASVVLALLDAARAHAPDAPCAWLAGYAIRAAGERTAVVTDDEQPRDYAAIARARAGERAVREALHNVARPDPRREPETPGEILARVDIVKRPQ